MSLTATCWLVIGLPDEFPLACEHDYDVAMEEARLRVRGADLGEGGNERFAAYPATDAVMVASRTCAGDFPWRWQDGLVVMDGE